MAFEIRQGILVTLFATLLAGCQDQSRGHAVVEEHPSLRGAVAVTAPFQPSRLPSIPNACTVAERRLDNRYVSRSVAFTFADAGSTRTTSPVLFAHRAWEADSPLPVAIIVCALPDTPEARESFSLRFSGRVLSEAQLGSLSTLSGAPQGPEWGSASTLVAPPQQRLA
jgi:hypothetical protein